MRTMLNRRVLFREVNERIREVNGATARPERLDLFCECGFDCLQHLHLPAWVYEETRLEDDRFLVKPGHDRPHEERLVAEGPGYRIVALRSEPEPARTLFGGGPAELPQPAS